MLQNKIDTKGVLRPIDPEIYVPGLPYLAFFFGSGIYLSGS